MCCECSCLEERSPPLLCFVVAFVCIDVLGIVFVLCLLFIILCVCLCVFVELCVVLVVLLCLCLLCVVFCLTCVCCLFACFVELCACCFSFLLCVIVDCAQAVYVAMPCIILVGFVCYWHVMLVLVSMLCVLFPPLFSDLFIFLFFCVR